MRENKGVPVIEAVTELINPLLLLSTRSCYVKAKGICFCCPQISNHIKVKLVPHEGWKGVAILFSCCSLHNHWLGHSWGVFSIIYLSLFFWLLSCYIKVQLLHSVPLNAVQMSSSCLSGCLGRISCEVTHYTIKIWLWD